MLNPKFEYGSQVRLIGNVRNDGSFPGSAKGELLMRRGELGYVRQAGVFLQDQVIYQVHFLEKNLVIGCKEQELIAGTEPWTANAFERGEKATLLISLAHQGEILAVAGSLVSVIQVERPEGEVGEICYRIQQGELDVTVPERALAPVDDAMPETEVFHDEFAA